MLITKTIGMLNFFNCIVRYKFLSKFDASTIFIMACGEEVSKKVLATFSSLERHPLHRYLVGL